MSQSAIIFDVQDVSKLFPVRSGYLRRVTGWLKAVDRVSFQARRDTIIGLVGESGSGKTTLGRLLVRLLEPTAGKIFFEGKDIGRMTRVESRRFRKNVQMLFQDPHLSLNPRKTTFQTICYPLQVHGLATTRVELRRRVAELLTQVGLETSIAESFPHELSGGQRQRVSLAAALAVEPQFIFCDEPVSALDASARAQVLNLLREVQHQRQVTMLVVSHDLSAVEYVCDEVAVMYLGGIVEVAAKKRLFLKPAHPYTQALMSAVPEPDPDVEASRQEIILEGEIPSAVNPPKGCKFHTRCFKKIGAICASEPPLPLLVEANHHVACHLYSESQVTRYGAGDAVEPGRPAAAR